MRFQQGDIISNRYQRWLIGCTQTAVILGLCAAACSRTELRLAQLCESEGEERACFDSCGEGTQVCTAGFWQACEVPPIEGPCSNDCGEGIELCVDGRWGECEVAPVTESCTNSCGAGERSCRDGRWGDCEVEPVVAPCEDECGAGEMECRDDTWGECEVEPVSRQCATACGYGHEWCEDGRWGPCDAPQPRPPKLMTTVRDLHDTHPDFESDVLPGYTIPGLVEELLGPDDKPVRVADAASITSDESFFSWYNDVPEASDPSLVNMRTTRDLQLEESTSGTALFQFSDRFFFPIDDELFGNEGRTHNFHFTLEAATQFRYVGGEIFRFTGDDDMWVFINRRLAIDLGGLHQPLSAEVELDAIAEKHDLVRGDVFPLHIFFAERHTIESNFTIETSIAGPPECD